MHIELEQRQDLCILRLRGRFLTGSNADYADVRTRLGVAACRNVVVECRAPQQKQCPSNRDAVRSPRLWDGLTFADGHRPGWLRRSRRAAAHAPVIVSWFLGSAFNHPARGGLTASPSLTGVTRTIRGKSTRRFRLEAPRFLLGR